MIRSILAVLAVIMPLAQAAAEPEAATARGPAGSLSLGMRMLFRLVDHDGNGAISQGEADRFLDGLFAQVDGNKDGLVSWPEMLVIVKGLAPAPAQRSEARRTFDQVDRNRDGQIDGREINRAATAHFRFLDADGDGAITVADLAGRDLFAPALGTPAP